MNSRGAFEFPDNYIFQLERCFMFFAYNFNLHSLFSNPRDRIYVIMFKGITSLVALPNFRTYGSETTMFVLHKDGHSFHPFTVESSILNVMFSKHPVLIIKTRYRGVQGKRNRWRLSILEGISEIWWSSVCTKLTYC